MSVSALGGRIAVITGGGSGIGAAMVAAFVEAGARVVACDVNAERVHAVAGHLGEAVRPVVGDVTDATAPDRFLQAALDLGGRVDVLCNNAGVMDRRLPVADVEDELWDRVLAVNLSAPFRLCRRALPLMLAQGSGVIVNTASVAGLRGGRAGAAYTAAKHGLVGLTANIAATYGRDGIRCNAICPGGVRTNITDAGPPSEKGSLPFYRPEPAEPAQIAGVAVFLASDAAAYVNGAAIVVDAGMLAV